MRVSRVAGRKSIKSGHGNNCSSDAFNYFRRPLIYLQTGESWKKKRDAPPGEEDAAKGGFISFTVTVI